MPIEAKQSAAHKAECAKIEVERWRNECLYLDWSDEAVMRKLRAVADTIRQVNDGRGADVIAFQEELRRRRVNVHIRASRGRDIAAACGQLAVKFE